MPVRLVVDTNIWVSALLNPGGLPAHVRLALELGLVVLVMSEPLLDEVVEVLARPRFARRYSITPGDIDQLVGLLRERSDVVLVTGTMQLCRDPDDDVVIETALVGHADAIVTQDDDLKSPKISEILASRGVGVLTVRRFIEMLDVMPETRDDPARTSDGVSGPAAGAPRGAGRSRRTAGA